MFGERWSEYDFYLQGMHIYNPFEYIEPIMSRLYQTHSLSRKLPVFIQIEALPFTESMSNAERRYQAEYRQRRVMSPYMRQCLRLWQMLQQHQFGFFFRWQVNPDALGLPNYWKLVQRPISLAIIWHKLRLNFYKKHEEFDADVRLMLANALTFNQYSPGIMVKIHNYADFYVKRYDEMAERLTRETLVDENKGRVHVRVTLQQKMRALRGRCFTEQKLQQMGGKLAMLSDDKRRQLHKAMSKKFSAFSSSKENIALEGLPTQQLIYLANLARNTKPPTFKPMAGKEKQAHRSLGNSRRREEEEESSFEIEEDE